MRIIDLLSFQNGINGTPEQYGKGIKYISVGDILNNDYITYDKIAGSIDINQETLKNYSVTYGDILFQRSSEIKEDIGRTNVYLDKDHTATFGGFVIRGKKIGDYNPTFFNYLLKSPSSRQSIVRLGAGAQHYNIGQENIKTLNFYFPDEEEQQKIASLFSIIDERIQTQIKIIRVLESQKKELSNILFNKYCKDSSYYPLEDIVSSESIKDFQIQTKDYLPNGKFEVVDQGKKEIIGYSDNSNKLYTKVPVIVYGDHTTIIKYREIPFIVGGDGVKLLKAKTGFLQKYIYYAVCQFNISSEGYKRHWNMLKNVLIPIPNYETQKIIIDTLDSFTKKIKNEEALLEKYRLQKQFLLNNLFI